MFVPPERTARYTLLAASERAGVLCLLPCCWLACLMLDDICLTLLWPDGSSTMESQVWICTLYRKTKKKQSGNGLPPLFDSLVGKESFLFFILLLPLILFIALVFFSFFLFFLFLLCWAGWLSLYSIWGYRPSISSLLSTSRARRTYQPDRWLDAEQALGPSRALQDKTGPPDPST